MTPYELAAAFDWSKYNIEEEAQWLSEAERTVSDAEAGKSDAVGQIDGSLSNSQVPQVPQEEATLVLLGVDVHLASTPTQRALAEVMQGLLPQNEPLCVRTHTTALVCLCPHSDPCRSSQHGVYPALLAPPVPAFLCPRMLSFC